MCVLVGLRAIG